MTTGNSLERIHSSLTKGVILRGEQTDRRGELAQTCGEELDGFPYRVGMAWADLDTRHTAHDAYDGNEERSSQVKSGTGTRF